MEIVSTIEVLGMLAVLAFVIHEVIHYYKDMNGE